MYPIRWHTHALQKRGEKVAYQGRKKCKTTNNLIICDNQYHILAISDCIAGNHHDSFEIVENIDVLIETLKQAQIDYHASHFNADAGFDVKEFIQAIEQKYQMIANIPKNKRNQKKREQQNRYLGQYIYSFRKKIETILAWLDTYKRILVRFEYKATHFRAWLLIAAALINLRTKIN